MILQAGCG